MSSPLEIPVSKVVERLHDLIEVESSNSIKSSVLELSRNKISSLAVYGQPGHWVGAGGQMLEVNGKQYIGLVSAFDLVSHLVKPLRAGEATKQYTLAEALNEPIVQLVGESTESLSLWWMPATESFKQMLYEFSKGIVHRALVVGEAAEGGQKWIKLVTQTDALSFALEMDLPNSHRTLASFGRKTAKVAHSVNAEMPLVDAVLLMTENSLLAVPVMNAHHNTVLTTLSVSDFKHLIDDDGTLVTTNLEAHTVGSFLDDVNGSLPPPLTFNANNTLAQTIRMMVHNHVHRLWQVEADGTTSVFSMSDAIALLLQ